jgi:hypothetical protein
MAVLAGLAQPGQFAGIRAVLTQRTFASPYMEKYVLEALCKLHSDSLALTRMKTRYSAMVNAKYTTLWEVWNGLSEGTINHGWNAPNTVLSQYIAGISPTAPGWSSYSVLPQMAQLTAVNAVVPSIKGNIVASDSLSASQFVMNLVSPAGTKALVGIPKKRAWQSVTANGHAVWNQGAFVTGASGISPAGEDSLDIKFNVDPGTWRFSAGLVPVAIPPASKPEAATSYSVDLRAGEGRIVFDPAFAGKRKRVEIYNLSGKMLRSQSGMKNSIDLRKDMGLPIDVYVVKVKLVR